MSPTVNKSDYDTVTIVLQVKRPQSKNDKIENVNNDTPLRGTCLFNFLMWVAGGSHVTGTGSECSRTVVWPVYT